MASEPRRINVLAGRELAVFIAGSTLVPLASMMERGHYSNIVSGVVVLLLCAFLFRSRRAQAGPAWTWLAGAAGVGFGLALRVAIQAAYHGIA